MMRTFVGAQGGTFNIPTERLTPSLDIHTAPCRYPFAVLAGALGEERDRFAALVARLPLYENAKSDRRFQYWAAKAGHS